jgi:hypothetical protein
MPPLVGTAEVGLPTQAQWIQGFQGWSVAKHAEVAGYIYQDHGRGVVFHLQPGHDLMPRAKLISSIDAYRDRGLKVYIDYWVTNLNANERSEMEEFWDRSEGRWDGCSFDAEAEWNGYTRDFPTTAHDRLDALMANMRPKVPMMGFTSYMAPAWWPYVRYGWWNDYIDFHLPQVYFGSLGPSYSEGDTALNYMNFMRAQYNNAKANQIGGGWDEPLKPIVPLHSCWAAKCVRRDSGGNCLEWTQPAPGIVQQHLDLGELALERYEHVQWYRIGASVFWPWPIDTRTGVFRQLPATLDAEPPPVTATGGVSVGAPLVALVGTAGTGTPPIVYVDPCL